MKRVPHIIKRNKKTELPQRIIYFDTESLVETEINKEEIDTLFEGEKVTKEHKLYLICAVFLNMRYKKETWKDYHTENLMSEFWCDCDKFCYSKSKLYIFSHNALYDTLVAGGITELLKLGYKVVTFSERNPFFLIMKNEETNKTINIISSTNYYQTSLKKLGEQFGILKTEIAYNVLDIKKNIEYCRNDVLILKTAMNHLINLLKIDDLGNFKITIAGLSYSAYKHRFMNKDITIHDDKEVILLERKSYAGGRNECFFIGKIPEKIYYLDINSMYPYAMKTFKYPVKLLSYRKNVTVEELKHLLKKGYCLIADLIVNTEENIYFKKDFETKKLLFPIGKFNAFLCTPEIEKAIEKNHIEKINAVAIYKSDDVFSSFVEYFYGKREEFKKLGDKIFTYLYKLFMNSLYGKWGQKNCVYERIGDSLPDEIYVDNVVNMDTGEEQYIKCFGGGIFKKVDLPEGEAETAESFPAISSHVTAYARMLLYNFISLAGKDNVFYCDTDSLFTNEEGYNNLKNYIDEYKLGYLKLEQESENIVIKGCKDYIFGDDIKIKGVTKLSKKIDDNTYVSVVWKGLTTYLKEKNLSIYRNELMIKRLKRNYTKGTVTPSGKVIPFKMFDNI